MVSRVGQFELYFNKEEQLQLVEKFGTTDKKELLRLIREEILKSKSESQNQHSLKDQKTEQEILKLKINNKIQLIRELEISPDETAEIIKDPKRFKVDEPIEQKKESKLSSKQWDNVYGAIIDGYHNPNALKICLACNDFEHFTDSKVRDHVIQNHPKEIREAIGSMGY